MERSAKKYKATKLPIEVFDEAELARAKLIMNKDSLSKLPAEVITPTICPICGNKLKVSGVEAKVMVASCGKCGYKQPYIDLQIIGSDPAALATVLGLGVLAGLGIAALLYLIFGGERK